MKTISKNGVLALMTEIHKQDPKNQINVDHPPLESAKELKKYLSESFLGGYLSNRKKYPLFLHNATNIKTFVSWLDNEYPDANHDLFSINFKLFGFLIFIETPEPYVFIENGLNFFSNKSALFNFDILNDKHSARQKICQVKETFLQVESSFQENESKMVVKKLINELDVLVDRDIRNAIAHSTYKICLDRKEVIFYDIKEKDSKTKSFEDVVDCYSKAFAFLDGFKSAIEEFCLDGIVKDCPCCISWGARY